MMKTSITKFPIIALAVAFVLTTVAGAQAPVEAGYEECTTECGKKYNTCMDNAGNNIPAMEACTNALKACMADCSTKFPPKKKNEGEEEE